VVNYVQVRNPERTRQRILRAALGEFAAKGYAGARVDGIAARAKVNKRLLYHYFGNKDQLFREVMRHKVAEKTETVIAAPNDALDLLPYWYRVVCDDPEWLRLVQWEALQPLENLVEEESRRREFGEALDKLRVGQREGSVTSHLGAEELLLAMLALTTYPQSFPQMARLITGLAHDSEEFRERWATCLRFLGRLLREHG